MNDGVVMGVVYLPELFRIKVKSTGNPGHGSYSLYY